MQHCAQPQKYQGGGLGVERDPPDHLTIPSPQNCSPPSWFGRGWMEFHGLIVDKIAPHNPRDMGHITPKLSNLSHMSEIHTLAHGCMIRKPLFDTYRGQYSISNMTIAYWIVDTAHFVLGRCGTVPQRCTVG